MEKFFNTFVKVISEIIIIFIMACIFGFILWLIYPIVINNVFPGLIKQEIMAGKIDLWVAICTTWFFAILIKSTNINNNNKE